MRAVLGTALGFFGLLCDNRMMRMQNAETAGLNQWIELNREAYHHNLSFFRRLIGPQRELCAVVKANAYGHGVKQMVEMARQSTARVDAFAVHSLDEALALRAMGVEAPVLLLGYTPHSRLSEVVAAELQTVVFDAETVRLLERAAGKLQKPVKVHLKVETGTHRQGVEGAPLEAVLTALREARFVQPAGLYTHFANIEDTTRHDYAQGQIRRFAEIQAWVEKQGLRVAKIHSACSAAVLLFPRTYGDLVRMGIGQYGLWPSRQTFLSFRLAHPEAPERETLRPVLTWKCRISQLKEVPAGRYVGYGCTYLTTRPTRLAVLPVGYSDGYDRRLSNVGYVLIHGRRAQIRGRVCMNLIMVDVTDIPEVRVEDEAVLLGWGQGDAITADALAELMQTINYEVVARLRPGIARIIV
jgi:alanine racemase